MEKYSEAWVREQTNGKTWLGSHACSLCGEWVGHEIHGEYVEFRSACGCSWSPNRQSSFAEIARDLAMQKSDEIRDRMMARLA